MFIFALLVGAAYHLDLFWFLEFPNWEPRDRGVAALFGLPALAFDIFYFKSRRIL